MRHKKQHRLIANLPWKAKPDAVLVAAFVHAQASDGRPVC